MVTIKITLVLEESPRQGRNSHLWGSRHGTSGLAVLSEALCVLQWTAGCERSPRALSAQRLWNILRSVRSYACWQGTAPVLGKRGTGYINVSKKRKEKKAYLMWLERSSILFEKLQILFILVYAQVICALPVVALFFQFSFSKLRTST